jgi:hypothetical protein
VLEKQPVTALDLPAHRQWCDGGGGGGGQLLDLKLQEFSTITPKMEEQEATIKKLSSTHEKMTKQFAAVSVSSAYCPNPVLCMYCTHCSEVFCRSLMSRCVLAYELSLSMFCTRSPATDRRCAAQAKETAATATAELAEMTEACEEVAATARDCRAVVGTDC